MRGSHLIKNSLFLKKLKTKLPYDPAVPLLGIYPPRLKAESGDFCILSGHSSIIHSSQKVAKSFMHQRRYKDNKSIYY